MPPARVRARTQAIHKQCENNKPQIQPATENKSFPTEKLSRTYSVIITAQNPKAMALSLARPVTAKIRDTVEYDSRSRCRQ